MTGLELNAIQLLGSIGGIGGILAVLIFLAYRYLVRQMREDRKFMENRLTGIIDDYNKVCRDNGKIMIDHTKVLTELIVLLKRFAKNGKVKTTRKR